MGIIFFEKNERHATWERSWGGPGGLRGGLGGLLGGLGAVLGGLGAVLERHAKIIKKIDTQNDPFWLPKAPPNGTKIDPKSDQKSIQKTKRKKNRTKTKIGPLKTPKVWFFLRKNKL